MTKTCSMCKEVKSISDYGKCKSLKSGLRSYCKKCANKFRKNWLIRNKHKKIEYYLKYRIKVSEQYHKKQKEKQEKNKCLICKCSLINRRLNTKYCNVCRKEVEKEWKKNDYKKNKITYVEWYKNNKDKVRIRMTKTEQKRRDNLSDRYIRKILYEKNGFTPDQIKDNPELIETKRIIIKTKRLCKT